MKLRYTQRARRHLDITREIVVPGLPYVVVHRVETGENEAIVILGVYHGAQLRPGQG